MELRRLKSTFIAALTIGAACPALAESIPTPGGEIVLTDPLVRAIQIGPPPVGLVTAFNPSAGVGLVALPGIGVRQARLIGVPVSWAGRRIVAATDLATGVEFTAVLPTPPQLVSG